MGGKRAQNVGVQKRGWKTKASCRRKIGTFFERENGWAKHGIPKTERKYGLKNSAQHEKIHRRGC